MSDQTDQKTASVSFLVYFDGSLHPVKLEQGESKVLDTGPRPTEEGWESLGAQMTFDGDFVTFVSATDGFDCDGRLSSVVEYSCHKDKLASVRSADGLYVLPDWERVSEQRRDYQAERAGY
jgi:hypothetical protein